jgi:hypothetical protein
VIAAPIAVRLALLLLAVTIAAQVVHACSG